MVQKCFIVGCKSQFDSATKLSFFQFPSEENQIQKWINVIFVLNKQSCGTISQHSRICEKQFQNHEIRRFKSKCALVKGAIPTIFMNDNTKYYDYEFLEESNADIEIFEESFENVLLPPQESSIDLTRMLDEQCVKESAKKSQETSPEETSHDGVAFIYQKCGYHNSMPSTSQPPKECNQKDTRALLEKKNYGQFGGLCYPVMEVVVLCRIDERNLLTVENEERLNESQMYLKILNKCLRDVPPKLFENMDDHIKECDPLENHRYLLIRSIIEEYLKVKLFHIGKLLTSELHRKFIRAKNSNLTLFAGQ